MLKLVNKYFAISPKTDPHSIVDIDGYTYHYSVAKEYYSTLDDAKQAFLQMTGEPYTDMNNASPYYIIEIKVTHETNRI